LHAGLPELVQLSPGHHRFSAYFIYGQPRLRGLPGFWRLIGLL